MPESFSVVVGRKPLISYVVTCLMLLYNGAKEISVKARGRPSHLEGLEKSEGRAVSILFKKRDIMF